MSEQGEVEELIKEHEDYGRQSRKSVVLLAVNFHKDAAN